MVNLTESRAQLKQFYKTHDPGRVKNVDPIFVKWSYDEIYAAVRTKYNAVPKEWEADQYEKFRQMVREGTPEKKVYAAMKKAGMDTSKMWGEKPGSFTSKELKKKRVKGPDTEEGLEIK